MGSVILIVRLGWHNIKNPLIQKKTLRVASIISRCNWRYCWIFKINLKHLGVSHRYLSFVLHKGMVKISDYLNPKINSSSMFSIFIFTLFSFRLKRFINFWLEILFFSLSYNVHKCPIVNVFLFVRMAVVE